MEQVEIDIRAAAFLWLNERRARHGDIFTWDELQNGFQYQGRRITLIGQTGIWFPRGFSIPISITTSASGPYPDNIDEDLVLSYSFRASGPEHRDNRGLGKAFHSNTPLVYFHGLAPGRYYASWPVHIRTFEPENMRITASLDISAILQTSLPARPSSAGMLAADSQQAAEDNPLLRRYAVAQTRARMHQQIFRDRVLQAYACQCAMCRLKHSQLLDAAHIIPDADPAGKPLVSNGMSLCKIHHAAYDQNILGVDPDYKIHIRQDILAETDGPMLKYGLQALDSQQLQVPTARANKPDKDALALRFDAFKSA